MSGLSVYGRSLIAIALISTLALAFSTRRAQAGPPPWPDAPYTYYADGKPLETVLREFASGFSLSTDLPSGLTQVVNGRFNLRNPTEFVDRLTGTYGLTWFTHAGTLFVSRSHEILVRSIPTANASGAGAAGLRKMLTDLQVLDARFGWGELPDQGVVVVSGPPAYVRLVETTINSLPTTPGGLQVAVFRLKHASVDDRTISYRDREITTPGVANILRNLVAGNLASGPAAGSTAVTRPPPAGFSATAPIDGRGPLGSTGSALPQTGTQTQNAPNTTPTASANAAPGASGSNANNGNLGSLPRIRPSIQSDPRINAIIVQDTPERIPVYERLIAQLDVPTPLIEIEALIIDVNSSRLDELGVTWNAMGRNQGTVLGYGTVNNAIERGTLGLSTGPRGAGFSSPGTIIANSAEYFVARLRLLEQQGDASIQARPSILTTENIGAVIDLSETFYIQTTSERTALVTPVTAGTTLRVTPRLIAQSGRQTVRLNVDIEDGQIQQTQAGGLPTVRRGTVSTEASVQEFESLLIGGYNSIQTVKGVEKVPGLGDIPIIGALFSSNSQQVQRRERLFLIRPTVIATNSSSTGLVELSKPSVDSGAPPAAETAARSPAGTSLTAPGSEPAAATNRRTPAAASVESPLAGGSSPGIPRPDVKTLEAQAVAGDTQARLRLAETYDIVLQQPERALPWYRQAAERGEASAQRRLAEMLYEAHGVSRDLPQAIQWFERAAAQGDAQAQYWLGYASMRGEGLPRDLAAARRYLTDSAQQGHQASLRALEALAPRGDAADWFSLGRLLELRNRDSQRAMPWYSRAAEQGNADALARLGELNYDGSGIPRDLDRARSLFKQAADKGSALAEFRLAGMTEAGLGSRADSAEALRLYQSAADKGQIDAMIRLAMAYERGELGLTRDEAQALRLREAARRVAQRAR